MTARKARKQSQRSTRSDRYSDVLVDRILNDFERAVDEGNYVAYYPQRGRPSLTGKAAESPSVGFRLTPELRARAEQVARRRGITVSALARTALEQYLHRVK